MKLRLPHSFYNPISYAGAAIAVIAIFMFVFLYVLSSLTAFDKAYVGIVIFIAIPAFIILGLLLIPFGMILKIRKQKKRGETEGDDFPILNLNLKRHRNATFIFTIGTTLFLFLSALGSYEAYHYTESVKFCGTLCHDLMIPEYTAYQESPHARVTCAECHVGEGANWYVKSKLSGLYQVYAALANVYPRPIPTPVKNLRPARETCEECHWPQKVYGKQQRKEIYYLPDEENTRWEIDMLMNTGGGNPALGQSSGIHWHINQNIKIEYFTNDEKRSSINRVVMTDLASGEKKVYDNEMEPFDESGETVYENRTMDCIDCHNRPSHVYRDPNRFVNVAIASGNISSEIPMIKQAAIEACMEDYESTPDAFTGIEKHVLAFYEDNYPDIVNEKKELLEKSIAGIQDAYSKNIFPEMNVKWEFYPDHIGHMTSIGCFRCHDGMHSTQDGQIISHGCNDCHLISSQGQAGQIVSASADQSLEFKHPIDIGEEWKSTGCYECHVVPPL